MDGLLAATLADIAIGIGMAGYALFIIINSRGL